MFISKNQRTSLLSIVFAVAILLISCGGAGSAPNNIVGQYYRAIESQNADTAASFFAEGAVITTPSGRVITGIDAIMGKFIPYDLQFMDRVEFLTDFTESNGKLSWSQKWHHVEGDTLENNCVITLENGKILEWVFQ